jgi:hypothetical protein
LQSFADALIDIIEDARDEGADHDNVPKILETANKVRPGRPAERAAEQGCSRQAQQLQLQALPAWLTWGVGNVATFVQMRIPQVDIFQC